MAYDSSFMTTLSRVISNTLTAIYQPFWFSVILTVFILFFYLYAYGPQNSEGIKSAIKIWVVEFKSNIYFRKLFVFVFFTVLILFKTLLNRDMLANPVSNVLGNWGIWKIDSSGDIELSTECIENLMLMMPFVFLYQWLKSDNDATKKKKNIIFNSVKVGFLFSLSIELLQLFLRLGTFQLSDIFYNTFGGLIGGLIFLIFSRVHFKQL